MDTAMREQAMAINRILEKMENHQERQPQLDPAMEEVMDEQDYCNFFEFQKANPPAFHGIYDPVQVEEWIKAMEKIFIIITCIKE